MNYGMLTVLVIKAIAFTSVVATLIWLFSTLVIRPLSKISIALGFISSAFIVVAMVFGVVFFVAWGVSNGWL
jgi:hypothetical protein